MKKNLTYLFLVLLLFPACRKDKYPADNVSISGFVAGVETMTTRAGGPEKTKFEAGDKIYVYAYSSASAGAGKARFMPETDGITGATYVFNGNVSAGFRFDRQQSGIDNRMGLWRGGLYHDFTAYHMEPKYAGTKIPFVMNAPEGLSANELLWGRSNNSDIYFSGDIHIIPQITFRHQLSRIQVRVIHDIEDITAENFVLKGLEFTLNKTEATFDTETGQWEGTVPGDITLSKALDKDLSEITRLDTLTVAEWWVLPDAEVIRNSNNKHLKLSLERSGALEEPEIDFSHFFDPDAPVETKPGYITVLQLEFDDVRSIVFTVSLEPWVKEDHIIDIED